MNYGRKSFTGLAPGTSLIKLFTTVINSTVLNAAESVLAFKFHPSQTFVARLVATMQVEAAALPANVTLG